MSGSCTLPPKQLLEVEGDGRGAVASGTTDTLGGSEDASKVLVEEVSLARRMSKHAQGIGWGGRGKQD